MRRFFSLWLSHAFTWTRGLCIPQNAPAKNLIPNGFHGTGKVNSPYNHDLNTSNSMSEHKRPPHPEKISTNSFNVLTWRYIIHEASSSNHLHNCLVQCRQYICVSKRFGIPFQWQSWLCQPSIQIIQELWHKCADETRKTEAKCKWSLSSPRSPNVIQLHPPKCGIKE